MSNFKKILVPIAFSNYSQEILTFGAEIATSLGAEILIINVVNKRDLEAINRITSYGYEVDEDHYLSTIQEERIKKRHKASRDKADDPESPSVDELRDSPVIRALQLGDAVASGLIEPIDYEKDMFSSLIERIHIKYIESLKDN